MIAAVIPTRYRPPELDALMRVLEGDGVFPIVLGSDAFEHRIYAMWNAGVTLARAAVIEGEAVTEVTVLNDDVELRPGSLPLMARALRSLDDVAVVYPDIAACIACPLPDVPALYPTTGTWGSGGMTGFAFMFKAELPLPPFDESYHWWYGDDAFERDVRAAGYRVARVMGVPVRHTPDGSASRDWERIGPLIAQDRARFEGRAA